MTQWAFRAGASLSSHRLRFRAVRREVRASRSRLVPLASLLSMGLTPLSFYVASLRTYELHSFYVDRLPPLSSPFTFDLHRIFSRHRSLPSSMHTHAHTRPRPRPRPNPRTHTRAHARTQTPAHTHTHRLTHTLIAYSTQNTPLCSAAVCAKHTEYVAGIA